MHMVRKRAARLFSTALAACHTFFYLTEIKKTYFFSIEIESLKAELSEKKNQLR